MNLNDFYGPANKTQRHRLLLSLGHLVIKSDKVLQWNNWRRFLLDYYGIKGTCPADEDKQLNAKITLRACQEKRQR